MIELRDRYEIDDSAKMRRTSSGYLVATPRVARTGIQLYGGDELGRPEMDVVRVYRPEGEVFKIDSLKSFGHKPMTDDHPPVLVDSKNWSKYSRGQTDGEVARDGQFIRVPMMISDAGLVAKVEAGKAELSVGYTCEIDWQSGKTEDGQVYDAIQKNIVANHIAVVDRARGGRELKIGDGSGEARLDYTSYADALRALAHGKVDRESGAIARDAMLALQGKGEAGYPIMSDGVVIVSSLRAARTKAAVVGDGDILAAVDSILSIVDNPPAIADGRKEERTTTMKTHIIDGITVEMSETAVQVVDKHIGSLKASVADLTKQLTDAQSALTKLKADSDAAVAKSTTDIAAKDAEIATLKKQLEDSAVTPAKLDQMVADRKIMVDKSKAVMGDKASTLVVDGKTDAEIRKQVVLAKVGDVAKDWSDDQIRVSFDTLTSGVDVSKTVDTSANRPGGIQSQVNSFSSPAPVNDSEKVYDARDRRLAEAWKGPAAVQQH